MTAGTKLLAGLVIGDASSFRDAMKAIDANMREVVFVRDKAGRIVGVVTDGGIRHGLLRGLTLEAKASAVMTRYFASVPDGLDRTAGCRQLPKPNSPRRPGSGGCLHNVFVRSRPRTRSVGG